MSLAQQVTRRVEGTVSAVGSLSLLVWQVVRACLRLRCDSAQLWQQLYQVGLV